MRRNWAECAFDTTANPEAAECTAESAQLSEQRERYESKAALTFLRALCEEMKMISSPGKREA